LVKPRCNKMQQLSPSFHHNEHFLTIFHWISGGWFEPVRTCSDGFTCVCNGANLELNIRFSSSWWANFEPELEFGSAISGSNLVLELFRKSSKDKRFRFWV
jgi:hypothetical protein